MQVFLGRELRLFTNSAPVKILKKFIRKFFRLVRAQANPLILLGVPDCVSVEQFVASRMKSRFWHVKPQLRTKLSTKIVDSQKKAFCGDHKKKLLKNYLKNLVQVDPAAAGLGSCVSAEPTRPPRRQLLRGDGAQSRLGSSQRLGA